MGLKEMLHITFSRLKTFFDMYCTLSFASPSFSLLGITILSIHWISGINNLFDVRPIFVLILYKHFQCNKE